MTIGKLIPRSGAVQTIYSDKRHRLFAAQDHPFLQGNDWIELVVALATFSLSQLLRRV